MTTQDVNPAFKEDAIIQPYMQKAVMIKAKSISNEQDGRPTEPRSSIDEPSGEASDLNFSRRDEPADKT